MKRECFEVFPRTKATKTLRRFTLRRMRRLKRKRGDSALDINLEGDIKYSSRGFIYSLQNIIEKGDSFT